MNYDFIEIGTSYFDTLIEKATNDDVGISVEPIKEYLDMLPSKAKVKKVNSAISIDGTDGELTLYYIPKKVIEENKLNAHLAGCNSIGDYHYKHKELKIEHLVDTRQIKSISVKTLFETYDVTSVDYLKIDVEGLDHHILNSLLDDTEVRPKKIKFEAKIQEHLPELSEIVERLLYEGYQIDMLSRIFKPSFMPKVKRRGPDIYVSLKEN